VGVATDKASELLLALRSNCREIYLLPKKSPRLPTQKEKYFVCFQSTGEIIRRNVLNSHFGGTRISSEK
jgi:hypothetical protein